MKSVLGIGNALVDILITLEENAVLDKFALQKGSMTLVDKQTMNAVLNYTAPLELKTPRRKSSGGSVANTIHGLAVLGGPAGYIGKIGADEYGDFFRSYMMQSNICATLFIGKEDSGKSIVLISPDSERTFATYLGAAIELDAHDLTPEHFSQYDFFHLEGYLVQNHVLVEAAVKLAKSRGCAISIDLASYNIVAANLDFLHAIVDQYVDIVFANEEEARAFTGKSDPEAALLDISKKCQIAVVKIGKEGSFIQQKDRKCHVPAIRATAIDTTGAGDLYASGFFLGLINGQELVTCGKIGAITSGNIVEVIGAKMEQSRWQRVHEMIKQM